MCRHCTTVGQFYLRDFVKLLTLLNGNHNAYLQHNIMKVNIFFLDMFNSYC